MTVTTTATRARREPARLRPLGLALACLLIVAAAGLAASSGAKHVKTLGKTKNTPKPACPRNKPQPCQVVGRLTGFQRKANGEKGLFKAPENGTVVAWSVRLSKPNKSQRDFFSALFKSDKLGRDVFARVAVLRHTQGQKYKLMRQSRRVDLESSLGDLQY